MMNYFCEVSTVWQVILLVLSLITVITLTGCCVIASDTDTMHADSSKWVPRCF